MDASALVFRVEITRISAARPMSGCDIFADELLPSTSPGLVRSQDGGSPLTRYHRATKPAAVPYSHFTRLNRDPIQIPSLQPEMLLDFPPLQGQTSLGNRLRDTRYANLPTARPS